MNDRQFVKIGKFRIGVNYPPFIVAEMSGNHNQSLKRALKLVDLASDAGAHAIKLQTYTADTMTLNSKNSEFTIKDKKNIWNNQNLYSLYKKAYTPWEWHEKIMKYANARGMVCFSSPFDETAVDFLESLNVPAYKIASFENNHLPLIEKVASTGKPMIISTGMASVEELKEACNVARKNGCKKLILLKCTSTYPASPENSNISTIPYLKKHFKCIVGLSDHTIGLGVPIASIATGACLIEKHFTISRKDGGVDSTFSIEPKELKQLVDESYKAWSSIGKPYVGPTKDEIKNLKHRRSIYVTKEIKKGDKLTIDNIKIVRPAKGLHPRYFKTAIGKKVLKNLRKNMPLNFSDFKS